MALEYYTLTYNMQYVKWYKIIKTLQISLLIVLVILERLVVVKPDVG